MPRVLVAPDSFKGTLPAPEVAEALAAGFEAEGWSADRCPLADGGEGTAAVLAAALGGERISAWVTDPLGRPIEASWTLLPDELAVVEVAEAGGLWLLAEGERDPLVTTTRGTGELIVEAARHARKVLIAVGGSATNDGARGALEVIADAGGLGGATLVCLCDVETPWELASSTFGPQKGADPDAVAELEVRMERYAQELPRDPRGLPRGGAAGGLAGGLWAALGAELKSGAAYVCDEIEVDARIGRADLVVGGEGRLDRTTLEGKVLAELAARCARAKKPLAAVVGLDDSDAELQSTLDLQAVLVAGDPEGLRLAAASLATRRP